ncbi:hypothetical protein Z969_05810 [Clostridium novyi A str. 4570]|uniref:G5 domain-containing protein n=1 Tax=Clostridium novyi A str. 4570 TaxID=1444290 RepID=A0AA88ZV42_CLONO|nr:ubiquitin-like domain-containing protein [Clostridium novyi]KGN02284.1 hypothetical protein Z969_05810 [Clostridium novyi A str. 4570]
MFNKIKDDIRTYFSNGPKKIVFVSVLVALCATLGVLMNMEKSVNIVVDGKETSVMTYKSNVADILNKNNVVLGPKDIVEPDLQSNVKTGDTIKIRKAMSVQLTVGNDAKTILTAANTVGEMLSQEKITLGKEDKISVPQGTEIKDGDKISITRVSTKVEKKLQPIDFVTEVKKDNSLKNGTRKVVQEGKAGQREINEKVIYENGKVVSREVVNQAIIEQPTKKVIAMGTLQEQAAQPQRLSRGGSINHSKVYRMRATAYTESYNDTGKRPGDSDFGITASGTRVRRNANGYSTVAVDPRVIPLGTKLYIEGYGYAIAEDTGGAIKGNKIDLYFNSDSQVSNWGVRYVNVYIVN